jgi:hypothetical protein
MRASSRLPSPVSRASSARESDIVSHVPRSGSYSVIEFLCASARKSRGDTPYACLNSLEKCAALLKPQAKAISVTVRSPRAGSQSSCAAAVSLQERRYSEGVVGSLLNAICT